jgi:hypothetical protein
LSPVGAISSEASPSGSGGGDLIIYGGFHVDAATDQGNYYIIIKELPEILKEDPEVHRYFLQLSRRHFADKTQTEDRFDRVLDEL